jgi:hypothetical protein
MCKWARARPRTRPALVVVLLSCLATTATSRVTWAAPGDAETAPGVAPSLQPPQRHVPAAAYVVLGLAAMGVVAGTIFGVKALHDKRDFDNGDRTTGRVEAIEKNAVIADMALGAAVALGVTSAVLFLTGGGDADAGQTASATRGSLLGLAPLASPSVTGAAAFFRF